MGYDSSAIAKLVSESAVELVQEAMVARVVLLKFTR
jgi:hypothetical protein